MAAFVLLAGVSALASGSSGYSTHGDGHHPANRYSGSAPVDLGRGLPFNNGTFGNINPAYEEQANSGYLAPGVRATPYTFQQRGEFVKNLKDLFPIYEDAIQNLKDNKDSRAEVKSYREQQAADLEKRLEAAKNAVKHAGSANEGEWNSAQEQARQAFADLQSLLVRENTKY